MIMAVHVICKPIEVSTSDFLGHNTNSIECQWAHCKRKIRNKHYGSKIMLQMWLNAYMWEHWIARRNADGMFAQLISDIASYTDSKI